MSMWPPLFDIRGKISAMALKPTMTNIWYKLKWRTYLELTSVLFKQSFRIKTGNTSHKSFLQYNKHFAARLRITFVPAVLREEGSPLSYSREAAIGMKYNTRPVLCFTAWCFPLSVWSLNSLKPRCKWTQKARNKFLRWQPLNWQSHTLIATEEISPVNPQPLKVPNKIKHAFIILSSLSPTYLLTFCA